MLWTFIIAQVAASKNLKPAAAHLLHQGIFNAFLLQAQLQNPMYTGFPFFLEAKPFTEWLVSPF